MEPDSIKVESGDTVIYHFRTPRIKNDRKDNGYYYMPDTIIFKAPSWAGIKTIIKTNGENLWFAAKNDSILFKPNTTVGGSWIVNRKRNVSATVTSININTFLGITDSVKTIVIGNKEFSLSKNNGFIKMPDIYNFYQPEKSDSTYPFSGTSSLLSLTGSTIIAGTKTKLTDKLYNDLKVNDVLIYTNQTQGYLGSTNNTLLYTITSKVIIPDSQIVRYGVDYCESNVYKYYSNNYGYVNTGNFSFGKKYNVLSYSDNIGNVPLKTISIKDSYYGTRYERPAKLHIDTNSRFVEAPFPQEEQYFNEIAPDTFAQVFLVEKLEASSGLPLNNKVEGIGEYYMNYHMMGNRFTGIIYYKSGSLELGTPTD